MALFAGCIRRKTMDYKALISHMLEEIDDERFLNQLRTLIKLHIERQGDKE